MVSYTNNYEAILGSFDIQLYIGGNEVATDVLTFGGKSNKKTRFSITGADDDAEHFMKQFIIKKIGKSKQSEVLSNIVEETTTPNLPIIEKQELFEEQSSDSDLFENAESAENAENAENKEDKEEDKDNIEDSSDLEESENHKKPKKPKKKVKFSETSEVSKPIEGNQEENIENEYFEINEPPSSGEYFETYEGSAESKKSKKEKEEPAKTETAKTIEPTETMKKEEDEKDLFENTDIKVKDDYDKRIDEIVEKYSEYLK